MTRLIHLSGYTSPQTGSFVPFLERVLAAARARGWDAEAVFPPAARDLDWVEGFAGGVPVHFVGGSRREMTAEIAALLGDGDEPTILHTHFTFYDVAAALAARRRAGTEVYWHVHTTLSSRPPVVIANALKFSLLGRTVARILCPAENIARGLVRRLAPSSKVSVFPSPVDVSAFPLLEAEQRRQSREALGVPGGRSGLLHFGRAWHLKGGDVFLDAVKILLDEGRPVTAVINQGGDEATREAEERGISGEVRVVGLDPQVQRFYGAAEVMVASSRGEGMPYAVVEALCSGTPVVASDLPGHRYLGDRLAACSITGLDAGEIAAAVGEFLDMDPGQRAQSCEIARRWIGEHLDIEAAADRLLEDYERSMATAERGAG